MEQPKDSTAEKEKGYADMVKEYFSDPARVRQGDIHECIDYVSTRAFTASAFGGVVGLGQGYTAGGMAVDIGAAAAFKWGVGASAFFGGAYGLRAMRERDDALNYGVSGAINYGIYRAIKLGPKGALTGFLMGAVGGTMYNVCSEELYDGLKLMWISKRRYLLTENPPVRISRNRVSPFPPRDPPPSLPGAPIDPAGGNAGSAGK